MGTALILFLLFTFAPERILTISRPYDHDVDGY